MMVSMARAVLLPIEKSKQPAKLFSSFYSPSLPVTNNQLTLTTANGHKGVDSLDSSLHGFPHRDTGDDTWSLGTNTSPVIISFY